MDAGPYEQTLLQPTAGTCAGDAVCNGFPWVYSFVDSLVDSFAPPLMHTARGALLPGQMRAVIRAARYSDRELLLVQVAQVRRVKPESREL